MQALLLGLVAGAARWVLTHRGVLVLLGLALLSLVPPLLTGHASSAGNHDTAIVGIVVHVLAAVCWIAGVGALWWHLATGRLRERALRRFGALAGWCLGLTVVSGLISAWVRIGDLTGITSWYGAGVLVKTAVLVGLGVLAARLREGVRGGEFTGLARLTAIEPDADVRRRRSRRRPGPHPAAGARRPLHLARGVGPRRPRPARADPGPAAVLLHPLRGGLPSSWGWAVRRTSPGWWRCAGAVTAGRSAAASRSRWGSWSSPTRPSAGSAPTPG
ncbi:hypothetical protein G5V59_17705 [Nocardioides sp. W3-2-3]|nr:hypothetical protein [Nocardioides convexus]